MSVALFDGVTLTVEAALSAVGSPYGLWGVGKWGVFLWGPDVEWTDVSDRVRLVSITRRFNRYMQIWESGSATVELDNRDGALSPDNLSGPYVTGGETQIRPRRPFRVSMSYGGTSTGLISGYSISWDEKWISAGSAAGDSWVRIDVVDDWAMLAGIDGVAVTPVGANESFGARLHRILDAAGHRGTRSVPVGSTLLQATDLSGGPVGDISATVEAEGGAAWIDGDGVFRAADKYALTEDTVSNTTQATFDDSGSNIPYRDIAPAYSGNLVINQAVYTRAGGSTQTVTDNTSRALYQLQRDTKGNLLCATDAEVLLLAQWAVARFKDPENRFESIEINPRSAPSTIFPVVRDLKERHLVQVLRHPPGGFTITRNCHIAGIQHTITPGTWSTRYDLWSATPYLAFASSRWGIGKWGVFKWFN